MHEACTAPLPGASLPGAPDPSQPRTFMQETPAENHSRILGSTVEIDAAQEVQPARGQDRSHDRDRANNEGYTSCMRRFAIALTVLVLAGCVEYRESLVLERDGSGTVVMAIGVKEALVRAAAVAAGEGYEPASAIDALRAQQGLQVIETRTETVDGTRWQHLTLTFESLAALGGIDRIEQYRGLFGEMVLTESPSGHQVLTRTIRADMSQRLEESFLPSLVAPMLARYPWMYEVTFPSRVLESNGESVRRAGAAKVVRWRFSLADLVAEPRVMQATFARTGVGPVGIALGAALMLVGILVARVLQQRRNRAASA